MADFQEENNIDLEKEAEEIVANVDTAKISEEIEDAERVEAKSDAGTRTVSSSGGGSATPKILMLLGVILAIGIGLVFWKAKFAGHHDESLTKVSKKQMELLVADFNPMQKKTLAENPEQKKELVTNISELLAVANQARKDGFADKPEVKSELEAMEKSLLARNYDEKINKDKGPMPPYGFVTEDQIKAFWGENLPKGGISWIWNGATARRHQAEFDQFIESRLAFLRKSGQISKDQKPTEEEMKAAKEAYARENVYYEEVSKKLAGLKSMPEAQRKEWEEFKEKVELQIQLQQAQYLASNYFQEVVKKKLEVTEADVQKYIASHPELSDSGAKKKQADEILKKVKDGGDFAELAKQFSEDPGSKENGGLYEGVAQGQFAPEFEKAALGLKPGEVAPEPVKTNFGYHIIKLEKKGEAKGANGEVQPTYDVRHILISTMFKDPENPMAREMPVEQYVKSKLEKERQEKVLGEINKNNPITVADFDVPKVSEAELEEMQKKQQEQMQQMQQEQIEQMRQQQQQPDAPQPSDKKPEGKK